ncbi:MAG: signal peptidase II [Planctomycetes bacterium]|nr:signal peptidase II [Planctomycetota bacterium]
MRWLVFFLIAILGAIGDLVTKHLTATMIPRDIISDVLRFNPVLNKGIIWGLFQQGSILFLVIPALAVPLIIIMFKYVNLFSGEGNKDESAGGQSARLHLWLTIAFGLILAGALGNLYDRIAYRAVRDFIDFYVINWPIFNLADTYITVGAGLIVISLFTPKRKPGLADSPAAATGTEPAIQPDSTARENNI